MKTKLFPEGGKNITEVEGEREKLKSPRIELTDVEQLQCCLIC
jgi:hypothetical protein